MKLPPLNAELNAFGLESGTEPLGVIAVIAKQPLRTMHVVVKHDRCGVNADLPSALEKLKEQLLASATAKILIFRPPLALGRAAAVQQPMRG